MSVEIASPSPPPARTDLYLALGVFAITFLVYGLTCCRTVYTGDSGDFLAAIGTGGIPHPSGYPLFLLLQRAWTTLLPFGEFAFRVNLLVSLQGAVAAAFVFRFLALLRAEQPLCYPTALFGAFLFAFAPTVWGQSLISEVYTFHLLFLSALLYYALRWVRTPAEDTRRADRRLAGLTFLFGLSLTNHLTMALNFPVFLALVLWHKRSLLGKDARLLPALIGLFLLPLALYMYLPLVARYGSAPIRWGQPDTWEAFLFHLLGRRYSSMMSPGFAFFRFSLGEYLYRLLPAEFGYGLVLAPLGLGAFLRRPAARSFGLALLAIFLVNVGYACNYATPDIAAYHLPSYLIVACWIAGGAAALIEAVLGTLQKTPESRRQVERLAALALCALPLLPLTAHWAETDKSGDYRERDYADNILRSLPPNAVLIMEQDTVFTLWYEQLLRKQRPDATIVQINLFTSSDIAYWYGDSLRRMYPWLRESLPPRGVVPEGDTALIHLAEQQAAGGRPVLIIPTGRAFPPEPGTRRAMILQRATERARREQAAAAAAPPPAMPGGARTFGQWMNQHYVLVPYGLCVRLYPRTAPPNTLVLAQANQQMWESFTLRGIFGMDWKSDTDTLHYWMAGRYAEARADCGRVLESAGRPDQALLCYRQAASIYPLPDAVDGIRRLGK